MNVTNLPAAPVTWSASIDGVAKAVTAGRISFSPNALGAGSHSLQIIYVDSVGADTSKWTFQVDGVSMTSVALRSSERTVDVTIPTVVLTASGAGGAQPTFTFAKDIAFTNVIQAESTNSSVDGRSG